MIGDNHPAHEPESTLDNDRAFSDLAIAARSVDEARESERLSLARELHDTVVQPLVALISAMELLPHQAPTVDAIMSQAQTWKDWAYESLDSLRRVVAGLSTHPHASPSLPEAFRLYLAPLLQSRGAELVVEVQDWPERLPSEWAFHLYLAVREAVVNAIKHGHASQIQIRLRGDTAHLHLEVVDNGVGFRPDRVSPRRAQSHGNGLGIPSMQDRARVLGGTCALSSAPGAGTLIKITVPYPPVADTSADVASALS